MQAAGGAVARRDPEGVADGGECHTGEAAQGRRGGGTVHRGEALLQSGAEPATGGLRRAGKDADHLFDRRQRGAGRGREEAGGLAAVHVAHDVPAPHGADHAAGADLPGVSDRRRDKIP